MIVRCFRSLRRHQSRDQTSYRVQTNYRVRKSRDQTSRLTRRKSLQTVHRILVSADHKTVEVGHRIAEVAGHIEASVEVVVGRTETLAGRIELVGQVRRIPV